MRYSVNIILRSSKVNARGLSPIRVRIIIDGSVTETNTGYAVPEKMWDATAQRLKDTHPQAAIINADITGKKNMVMRRIVEAGMAGRRVTSKEAQRLLTDKSDLHNLFDFVDQLREDLLHKRKKSTLENYRKHAVKIQEYIGGRNLSFEDITANWLRGFEAHLRKTVDGNYVHSIFSTLRAFFNQARRRGLTISYPFATYDFPTYKAPGKPYLTVQELAAWEAFARDARHSYIKQAATWFLFGCYTGLRVSDWHVFNPRTHIQNERLKLHAKKNGELVTMPISKPLARVLNMIETAPLTLPEQRINIYLQKIAEDMELGKHLTTHVGRHTFAISICAEQGISVETAAELMGITVTTCANAYYRVTKNKIMEEAKKAWRALK